MYKIIDENNDCWGEYLDFDEAVNDAMDMFCYNESFNIIDHLSVINDSTNEVEFNTKELYEQVY